MYPIKIKPFGLIPLSALVALSALSPLRAESGRQPAFYQQLYPEVLSTSPHRASPSTAQIGSLPSSAMHEDNPALLFNYLWLQQYQAGYKSEEGSAALGKLFRMGIKSLYRNHREGDIILPGNGDDDLTSHYLGVDYKLRLNEDKVSVGIDYEF